MNKRKVTSKFLSYILRHHPDEFDLAIDQYGWVNIDDLIQKLRASNYKVDRDILQTIVADSDKKRFSFSPEKKFIRANYGHSISVSPEMTPETPPETLYHGTARRFVTSIKKEGLSSMDRNFVHLSMDMESARETGERHGNAVVLTVASGQMQQNGFTFFPTASDVWLVDHVPPDYLHAAG